MAHPRVEFHPAAVQDAAEALAWYAERSPASAERFGVELDLAIDRIAANPDRWPVYLHGTRRCPLKRFPFVVVFRVVADGVLQVLAVAHAKRRPGYWRKR